MGVTDFPTMSRPKNAQDLHHWARGLFKGVDIDVDMEELNESFVNMNALSLSHWLFKFMQEVVNKSDGWYPSWMFIK